ncbi:MAG: hypothetical protein ACK4IX_10090 [Candidatus Sericytochromatia bacterium]
MNNIILVFSKNDSKPYRLSDKDVLMGFITYFLFLYFCIFIINKITDKLDK